MDIDRSNYSYTFEEYESDVKSLKETLSAIENLHLVAVYRGSIPLVAVSFTHLTLPTICSV